MKTIACELPVLPDGETRQRVQLFPSPGEYVHPASGSFTLTADHIDEYAADIAARDSISVDRDHSFIRGNGSKAAGWVQQGTADVASDGSLWADIEWTPVAAAEVRAREYRYLSPEFNLVGHRTPDGKALMEPKLNAVAMTNRPFFSMMAPLAADELPLEDSLMVAEVLGEKAADTLLSISAAAANEVIAAAAAAGGTRVAYADPGYRKDGKPRYPLTSPEDVQAAWKALGRSQVAATYDKAQITRIKARLKRAALKFGVTFGADESTKKEKTMELTEAIAADLGVAVDADDETVLAAMQAKLAENKTLAAKVPADGTVTIGADELVSLKASAAKADKTASDLLENRKKVALDGAVKEFRIAASEKDYFAAAFDRDPDGTETFLAEKTPIVSARHGSSAVVDVDGESVNADLRPVPIDGVDVPVLEDRAKVVAAVDAKIRAAGKDPNTVTADEYAAFAAQVYATA